VTCTPRSAEALRKGEQAGRLTLSKVEEILTLKALALSDQHSPTALLRQTMFTGQERESPKWESQD